MYVNIDLVISPHHILLSKVIEPYEIIWPIVPLSIGRLQLSMMQGQERGDLPLRHRRSPYTPTWHLQGPPAAGNAHVAYVKHIPSASTMGSRMGQMAPPPYQLAPPPPQPSRAQQLLVLTPLEQSMRGAASEAEAHSMAATMEWGLLNRMPPPHPPPYQYMPPPPQLPRNHDQLLMPPPQRPPTPYRAQSLNGSGNGQVRSAPGLMLITEKMANMQSTYDQNARPITADSINDSDSNFEVTAFQVKSSNVKVIENTNDHNQSSHALKDVIQDQGSYVNQNQIQSYHGIQNVIPDQESHVNKDQIQPGLIIDNAIKNPDSGVTQDQIQPRQFLNNVNRDQESHVNQGLIQPEQLRKNVILDQGSHINHNQVQSEIPLDNADQDRVLDNEQDQIQLENIISQPDIDYITMTTSDNDNEDILTIDKQKWASPSNTDRKRLLYDNEFKAYKLSSLQLKAAKAMLVQEVAELEQKPVKQMLLNPKATTTSYTDHYDERDFLSLLYLSSFIISSPGCSDKYKCKACDKEYTNRQSFRVHHRSRLHLKNFDDWIRAKEQENLLEPLNKKQKLSDNAIILAKKAIANHQQVHGMAQNDFFMTSKQFQNPKQSREKSFMASEQSQEKEKPIEVIDLPKQIADQEFNDYTKASQALKEKCPAHLSEFKRNILNVLAIIYFDRNYCTLDVHFDKRFYYITGHQKHHV